ncbi:MAG: hypothetical protein ACRC5M_04595 [Anaeroplasmataceae bacterium]
MGKVLTDANEIKQFLTYYSNNIESDERIIIQNEPNKIYVIDKGDYVNFDNRYCLYVGFISNPQEELDRNTYCLYRIGGRVYYHKPPTIQINEIKTFKRRNIDTSEFLDVSVNERDNELMQVVKFLLKGVRVNAFKSLFSDVSDFNNIRREITNGNGQLTWNRFILILELLGFDHIIAAVKKDGEIIGDKTNKEKIRDYYMKEGGSKDNIMNIEEETKT